MTTSATTYNAIASLISDIYQGSFFTLRSANLLVRTVTVYRDTAGMQPRKATLRNAANVREVAEGEDVTPTNFDKSLLATLTPARKADQFLITDQDFATDPESVREDAAMEFGGAFAEYADTQISSQFSSLNGGTVGAYLGTVTWSQVLAARGLLLQAKAKPPFYCVLGAGQWYHLMNNGGSVQSSFTLSPMFNDALTTNGYVSNLMGDTTFVICPNISGATGGSALGALYARPALAYDERKAFNIRPQRDESREAWELNASMWFAKGVWRSTLGIQIKSTDVIPTT